MSMHTMQLKKVVEYMGGSVEYKDATYKGINYYLPHITGVIEFDKYPIFNEDYRPILSGKIYDRFMNRDIGTETIDDFKRIFRSKMNEIMPLYNQLLASTEIEYEALSTVDIGTITTGSSDSTGTVDSDVTNDLTSGTITSASEDITSETEATGSGASKSRSVESQTPQQMLGGMKDYASAAADSNSETSSENATTTSTNSASDSDTDTTTQSVTDSDTTRVDHEDTTTDSRTTGYQGVPADLIMRYRDSFLNIDLRILEELEECFMLVLNTGDAYTRNGWIY